MVIVINLDILQMQTISQYFLVAYKLVYEYVFTWSVMATQRLTLFVNISSYIQFCVLKVISKEA